MNSTESEEGADRRVCDEIRKIKDEAEKLGGEGVVERLGDLAANILKVPRPSPLLWSSLSSLCSFLLSSQRSLPSPSLPTLLELRELLSYLAPSASLHAELNDLLGQAYLAVGQTIPALLCLHKAVRATVPSSDRCSPYINLSLAYFRLENYRQSVRFATQAVVWALEDLNSTFPRSSVHAAKKARVMALYSLLAECEDALGRSDRVDYWLRRSISGLSFLEFQGRPHCPSPDLDGGGLDMQSRSSIASVEYGWSCDSKESSLSFAGRQRKMSDLEKKPEEMLKTEASDSIHDRERMKTNSTEGSSGRHRVSLKIRSRGQTVSSAHPRPLHQSWRHLASGLFAHITISDAPGDHWHISVKAVGHEGPKAEKVIEKRNLQAKDVASMVELDGNEEIAVSDGRPAMIPTFTSSESITKRTILYSEKKTFSGFLYDIIYTLDESTRNVTIYAKTRGKTIRKTIINDIRLPSTPAVLNYVKEVLAPQVEVVGEKIKLESMGSDGDFTLVLAKEAVIQPDFECKVTIFKPNEPYLNWKINAEGRLKLFCEVSGREINELTHSSDDVSIAEAILGLLVVENGTKLSLIHRIYHSGYSITVTPVPLNIHSEYHREPVQVKLPKWTDFPSKEVHAAVVLQRFLRKCLAKQRLRTLQRGVRVRHRFVVRGKAGYEAVVVSELRGGGVRVSCQGDSGKPGKTVERAGIVVDFSSQRSVEETALRLLSSPDSRETEENGRLLVTRRQVIKGESYLLSVYTRDGHVEIKATKQQ